MLEVTSKHINKLYYFHTSSFTVRAGWDEKLAEMLLNCTKLLFPGARTTALFINCSLSLSQWYPAFTTSWKINNLERGLCARSYSKRTAAAYRKRASECESIKRPLLSVLLHPISLSYLRRDRRKGKGKDARVWEGQRYSVFISLHKNKKSLSF